jgi:hypothetical protein
MKEIPTESELHDSMHQVAARFQKPDRTAVQSMTRALSFVSLMLNEMSLNPDYKQCDRDALSAGALMLASQSDEIRAGGETEESADFHARSLAAVCRAYSRRMHESSIGTRLYKK